jgi:hypothetical protein
MENAREFIDFLHENGIDKYIELPQIAVMGDTSIVLALSHCRSSISFEQ